MEDARALLEEGAIRSRRTIDPESFDIAPGVNVCIDDDLDRARDQMRHFIALYVGGMGSAGATSTTPSCSAMASRTPRARSRTSTSTGKKNEAAAAVLAELIDTITLVGPREKVRDRLAVYRGAGVGTLIVSAVSSDLSAHADRAAARGAL